MGDGCDWRLGGELAMGPNRLKTEALLLLITEALLLLCSAGEAVGLGTSCNLVGGLQAGVFWQLE